MASHQTAYKCTERIDPKIKRRLRRSQEWQNKRDEMVNRRRKIGAMSPCTEFDLSLNYSLLESTTSAKVSGNKENKKISRESKQQQKCNERMKMLQKWKEEKEMLKKQAALNNAKCKPFVLTVSRQPTKSNFDLKWEQKLQKKNMKNAVPVTESTRKTRADTTTSRSTSTATSTATTRMTTRAKTQQADVTPKPKPSSSVLPEKKAPSTRRATRYTSVSESKRVPPATRCTSVSESKRVPSATSVSESKRVPSVAAQTRVTRQTNNKIPTRSNTRTLPPTTKAKTATSAAQKQAKTKIEPPVEDTREPVNQGNLEALPSKVTTRSVRETVSFVPGNFVFTAPENLQAYDFASTLSPNSTQSFFFDGFDKPPTSIFRKATRSTAKAVKAAMAENSPSVCGIVEQSEAPVKEDKKSPGAIDSSSTPVKKHPGAAIFKTPVSNSSGLRPRRTRQSYSDTKPSSIKITRKSVSCHKMDSTKVPQSPEEWVELLKNSPMIEMTRRKISKNQLDRIPTFSLEEDAATNATFKEGSTASGGQLTAETVTPEAPETEQESAMAVPEEAVEMVTQDAAETVTQEAAETVTQDAAETVTQEAVEAVSKETQEAVEAVSKEAQEEVETVTQETPEMVTEGAEEMVTQEAEETITQKATKTVTQEAPETVNQEVGETVTQEAEEMVTQEAPETVTQEAEEVVTQEAAKTVTQEAVETVTEKEEEMVTLEAVTKVSEETVTQEAEEMVIKDAEEMVTQDAVGTVIQEAAEMVTEEAAVTVTQEAAETVTQEVEEAEEMVTKEAAKVVTEEAEEMVTQEGVVAVPQEVAETVAQETTGTATLKAPVTEPQETVEMVTTEESTMAVPQVSPDESSQPNLETETADTAEHNVSYFRNIIASQTEELNSLWEVWETIIPSLNEEVEGEVRTVIGQAKLLISQRFRQFIGLVDNCEFNTGEKETTCEDLQGFWDMVDFQVEDVKKKFVDLQKLKDNNWQAEVLPSSTPVKRVRKLKPVASKVSKVQGRSKFAKFLAQKKKLVSSSSTDEEAVKVFDGHFFKVESPVRSPKPHCSDSPHSPIVMPVFTNTTKERSADIHEEGRLDDDKTFETVEKEPKDKEAVQPVVPGSPLDSPLVTPLVSRCGYAPAVPSPLLQDITPIRKRVSTARRSRLLSEVTTTPDISQPVSSAPVEEDEDIPVFVLQSPPRTRRRSQRVSKRMSAIEPLPKTPRNDSTDTQVTVPTIPIGQLIDLSETDVPLEKKTPTKRRSKLTPGVQSGVSRRSSRIARLSVFNTEEITSTGLLENHPNMNLIDLHSPVTSERKHRKRSKSVVFADCLTEEDENNLNVLTTVLCPVSPNVEHTEALEQTSRKLSNKFGNLKVGYTPIRSRQRRTSSVILDEED